MKKTGQLFICWMLTLSLAGLPVYSFSANALTQSDHEPCQQMAMGSQQHSNTVSTAHALATYEKINKHCSDCGDKCTCATNAPCHYNTHQTSAILQTHLLNKPDLTILIFPDISALYRGRDIEPEITPPIV